MEENMQANIRWTVTDPLGNAVILYEERFARHLIADHKAKDAGNRASVEKQVQKSIANPRFIINDQNYEGRRKYLDLVDVPEGDGFKIKTLTIVVENNHKVVTWILKRNINEFVPKEEIIYDSQMV